MLVATLWHWQVCVLGTISKSCRNGEMNKDSKKCTISRLNIYSTQMLPTRVFVFHQCQSNHGTVFQASVITLGRKKREQKSSGMREGRFEDVVERMTKKGKMRPGKQERLRVQRQTVREEVS